MTDTPSTSRNWTRIVLYAILGIVAVAAIGLFILWQVAPISIAFAQGSGSLEDITLPEGFTITTYAENVTGARSLALSDDGTLFISSRGAGNVYAVPDATSSDTAPEVLTVASGLRSPNGIDIIDGDLYVAEIGRINRYDNIEADLTAPPQPTLITDALPEESHHGWRYMRHGPDGMLYIGIGAPCNVCELEGDFGTISRLPLDGSTIETYATGVRNSVGFDWNPDNDVLWFTNNGRDWMGNDSPPDTLHRASEPGLHFGFPYCHAGTIPDPDFGSRRACDEFEAPDANLTPHGAALGMRFYTSDAETAFPDKYQNQIFIAEHGSWNRNPPIGYRVMLATLDEENNVTAYEPFAAGWLNERTGQAWGRPVDVLTMPDGALLVSDDAANAVYRIAYTG